MFNYPVTLAPDSDTVLVTFADVPEAISFGMHEDDACQTRLTRWKPACRFTRMHARCCQSLALQGQEKTVRPSALECAKLSVYQAMTDQGIE